MSSTPCPVGRHGRDPAGPADFCRPFHADGEIVEAARGQLTAQAEAFGWTLEHERLAYLHLVVDGQRIEPALRGFTARFFVPADAQQVCLMSNTARPSEISESGDDRDLSVCLIGLAIDDGFGPSRPIALDEPLLSIGFHDVEDGTDRWTAGRTPF